MSYSTDPVADAADHFDALYDREDRIQAAEKAAREEIIKTLTVSIREVNPAVLTLPKADVHGTRVIRASLEDEISDRIAYGKPLFALLAVLSLSNCPYVAALRKVLADDYADSHADEIGMAMEGDE